MSIFYISSTWDYTTFHSSFFLIGDDAFPLRSWMMKPYSRNHRHHDERIFNYRLSRARGVVESVFGILAMRFQIWLGTIQQIPQTVVYIVLACTTIHKLLRIIEPVFLLPYADEEDNSHNFVPGQSRQGLQLSDGEAGYKRNVGNATGTAQSNYFKDYLNYLPGGCGMAGEHDLYLMHIYCPWNFCAVFQLVYHSVMDWSHTL